MKFRGNYQKGGINTDNFDQLYRFYNNILGITSIDPQDARSACGARREGEYAIQLSEFDLVRVDTLSEAIVKLSKDGTPPTEQETYTTGTPQISCPRM